MGKSGSSSRSTRTRTTETRDVKTRRSRSSGGRTRGSETKGLGGARRGWTRSSAAKTWWTRSRRRGWVRHGNPCGNHLQRGGRQGGGDCLEEDGHLPGVSLQGGERSSAEQGLQEHQQELLREVKSYRQEKIQRQEAEWVGLGKEARSAARMEHQENREVQAGIRGWAGSRSKSCHQDGASRPARSQTWDGVGTRIFWGDGRRKGGISFCEGQRNGLKLGGESEN